MVVVQASRTIKRRPQDLDLVCLCPRVVAGNDVFWPVARLPVRSWAFERELVLIMRLLLAHFLGHFVLMS